ncbi:MAG: RNA polymerase recycling motor ATPase HelR [Rhodoglobus sp.]
MTLTSSAFTLPDRLAAKAKPTLIAADEQQFARLAHSLEQSIAELSSQLDVQRKSRGGSAGEVVERDLQIRRLSARLRLLDRYGLDLCLGRMVDAAAGETLYIGRLGLTDSAGARLLVDWRSPAAEPFFGATHANPMGLASRRRYRWTRGRVSDYWDEVFTADLFEHPDALEDRAALDDQSAFIASLGGSRSAKMRDVLGTIQADQDAIIRAGSRGALVVDGGPGTGKTVVALHRSAYLVYSEPRITQGGGGVLFVGPSPAYLAYVDDVLPSLGDDTVQIATLRDLVAEGATAGPEANPDVALLKSSAQLVGAIETAVRLGERPPSTGLVIETPWADIRLSAAEWAEAFAAAEAGSPHNEARDQVWEALLDILVDKLREDLEGAERESSDYDDQRAERDEFDAYGMQSETSDEKLRRVLAGDPDLRRTFGQAWPLVEAADLVADLWAKPALLHGCAPWLTSQELATLHRVDPRAWTVSDLPLLDAARQLLGDPEASRVRRRRAVAAAEERERMSDVVSDLIASDDSEMGVMSMLRGQDLRSALVDDAALPSVDPDRLAGPFAHIVVDEAQELTDAEWQMLLRRCPSRSFTIVGDRAQARHGFTETWLERLQRIGLDQVTIASLTVNYRTPEEIMAEAAPVIRAVLPDANVPTSIRSSGVPVVHSRVSQLHAILDAWLAANADGVAVVIGDAAFAATARVRSLTPELSKGLEFDLVVLVRPDEFGGGIEGAVDRYVAMTRATQQLVVLS